MVDGVDSRAPGRISPVIQTRVSCEKRGVLEVRLWSRCGASRENVVRTTTRAAGRLGLSTHTECTQPRGGGKFETAEKRERASNDEVLSEVAQF